jgi:D-beta-D-heptose 7-phosphate kinase/D-beta-D-heptose 1-phosphate adenosyltransferase
VLVLADPKRPSFGAYHGVDVLTPNVLEVSQATGIAVLDDAAASVAGEAARVQAAAAAVLVTRSEKGMTLVRRGLPALHVPTRARAVADVSGAGDTMIATLATALAIGSPLPEAAALANVAAGIAVGKLGTATVLRSELSEALHFHTHPARKILDRPAAVARVAAWRRAGLKVGFTNGCFDLLHPGVRPAGGGVEHRCVGASAERPDPAGAVRNRAGDRDGGPRSRRSGGAVR